MIPKPFRMLKTILISGLLLVNIGIHAQQPNISYSSMPQSYPMGIAITSITPTNSGGAIPQFVYGEISTVAGTSVPGNDNGPAITATFGQPEDIVIDSFGNIYISDFYNRNIRKISIDGIVSTFAGSGTIGATNGTGTEASFFTPNGLTIDASNNVYVVDTDAEQLRKITPDGVVTTIITGHDGNDPVNGTIANARLNGPVDAVVDAAGTLYVVEHSTCDVRRISVAENSVTRFAGAWLIGYADGPVADAKFNQPNGIAMDASGTNMYVGDTFNYRVRQINGGMVSTLAGNDNYGTDDGVGTAASFDLPLRLVTDVSGNVYVLDSGIIRKITPDGVVSTLIITPASGELSFTGASGIIIDSEGNFLVTQGNRIRKISGLGYTITPDLPAGLSFNSRTGVISGTPTSSTPTTTYTITGYNKFGSSVATVTFATGTLGAVGLTQNSFNVYPNPVSKALNIISNDDAQLDKIEICDIQGKVIYEDKTHYIDTSINSINMESVEKGVYLLKLHTDRGLQTKKIVKK